MADLRTLETYSQTPKQEPRRLKFILLMSVCGFTSGVVTANLPSLLGGPFGVALAISLAISGVMPKTWKLICLIVITTAAFYISLLLTGFVELSLPWKHLSMDAAPTTSPVSLFAGGMAGGFIVLTGSLLLASGENTTFREIASKALLWSVFSGILAPIAWAFGPSLGTLVVPNRQRYAIAEFSNQCCMSYGRPGSHVR